LGNGEEAVKIDLITGCRPNLVKAAALLHAAKDFPQLEFTHVHTGQHYGIMSDPYFQDLRLPTPELGNCIDLRAFKTPVERLSRMILELAQIFQINKPDGVLVVGDTDSTLAGALAAAKMGIPVLHVEAGLRSGDGIQEEVNRILVDSISLKHYTTSQFADQNLKCEGKKGIRVGNVMVDTLLRFLPFARAEYPHPNKPYAVFTMHRAENVDDEVRLGSIVDAVRKVADTIPVIWVTHPRLRSENIPNNITRLPPMGYLEFISLLESAKFVMTDSGGVQEESSVLQVPCFTLRKTTERPETVFFGSNILVPDPKNLERLVGSKIRQFSQDTYPAGSASRRIMEDLCATSW
jgi:UDP-N-acetylglucosamine 2-epimerase (non-hydrolysing)